MEAADAVEASQSVDPRLFPVGLVVSLLCGATCIIFVQCPALSASAKSELESAVTHATLFLHEIVTSIVMGPQARKPTST